MSNTIRKKILFHYMIGGTAGGSDTCLFLLLKYLDQSKYDIYLLYKDRSKFVDELESLGIKIIQVYNNEITITKNHGKSSNVKNIKEVGSLRTFLGGIKKIVKERKKIKNIMKIIDDYKIDIIHGNHYLTGDRVALIAGLLKRKVVISHNRGLYPPDIIDKYIANKIDEMICMSDFSKSVYTQNGISDKKCKTIYDGIEIDEKDIIVKSEGETKIGCFGRLENWKGQKTLVNAVEIIKKTNTNIKVYLVGNGPSEEELKQLVKEKGLEDLVVFTGHITNVKDYMQSCSIVVHTSIVPEPFGMVITEAMALGKPVIATNFGGPLEIIDNEKDGFLIPPQKPIILAETILKLLKDLNLRNQIGKKAKEKVISKFDVKDYAKKIEQEYENI